MERRAVLQHPDLNADGKADICGRGSGGMWCALSTGNGFAPHSLWIANFTDALGWNAVQYYSTITFPDLNNDRRADVCGRGSGGIWCAVSTGNSFASFALRSSMMTDANGWNAPQYYSTIQFPDLNNDGNADLCGRGGAGVYCAISTGSSFGSLSLWSSSYSDANGWNAAPYYSTLAFPDLDGDDRADVCGRGVFGIYCARSGSGSFGAVKQWTSGFSDAAGGNVDSTFSTISYPDINADGLADVCGRTSTGVFCATSTGDGFSELRRWSTDHTNAAGWSAPQYYRTISFADVDRDGRAELCARGPGGVSCELP
jgi:hypothetical protein